VARERMRPLHTSVASRLEAHRLESRYAVDTPGLYSRLQAGVYSGAPTESVIHSGVQTRLQAGLYDEIEAPQNP
jgi:hypothetical protein